MRPIQLQFEKWRGFLCCQNVCVYVRKLFVQDSKDLNVNPSCITLPSLLLQEICCHKAPGILIDFEHFFLISSGQLGLEGKHSPQWKRALKNPDLPTLIFCVMLLLVVFTKIVSDATVLYLQQRVQNKRGCELLIAYIGKLNVGKVTLMVK